jgi:hypothetical protein
MSANNGIYVLITPKGTESEFRVKHMMEIENMYFDHKTGKDSLDHEIWIKNARKMFARAKVFTDKIQAVKEAKNIEKKIGWTEHGVCQISIPIEF